MRKKEIELDGQTYTFSPLSLRQTKKGLLDANKARTNEVTLEINRRQGVVAQAAREKAYEELCAAGEDAGREIFEILTELVVKKILAFDDIRKKLATEFRDLGGETRAKDLREILFKHPGPRERTHDPNLHLRRLNDLGWVSAGVPGPSLQTFRNSFGDFEVVPGGALSLTVCSMRPRK
jgi:hypothetical protein